MPPMRRVATYLKVLAGAALVTGPALAADATVAVAANFLTTARALETAYEAGSGFDIRLGPWLHRAPLRADRDRRALRCLPCGR